MQFLIEICYENLWSYVREDCSEISSEALEVFILFEFVYK